MTTTQKVGIGVVGLIVIALLGAYALHYRSDRMATESDDVLTTSPTDTSDQALEKDTAAIDAQLTGLNDDSAAIDQSLSDDVQ